MESPFEKALREVTRGFEDENAASPPSWSTLNYLLGHLSHQESKIRAINAGLPVSLLQLYNAYSELAATGSAWVEKDLSLYSTCPAYVDYASPTTAADLTFPCRAEAVRLLHSIALFPDGRAAIHVAAGLSGALALFADPSACVRLFAADLLRALLEGPDASGALLAAAEPDNDAVPLPREEIAQTLYAALATDPDPRVVVRALAVSALVATSVSYAPANAVDTVLALLTDYAQAFTGDAAAAAAASSSSSATAGPGGAGVGAGPSASASLSTLATSSNVAQAVQAKLVGLSGAAAALQRLDLKAGVADALQWLCHIAGSTEELRMRCVVAGAVAAAAPLLASSVFEHRRLAASAVLALTSTRDAAGKEAVLSTPGLLPALAAVALDLLGPASLRINAVLALRAAAQLPAALPVVGELLSADPRCVREVLGPAASAALVALQLQQPERRPAALAVLEVLLKAPQGGAHAWSIPGIVVTLDELAQHSANATAHANADGASGGKAALTVALLASKCLSLLCQNDRDARAELEQVKARQQREATAAAREGFVLHQTIQPEGLWPQ